MTTVSVPHNGSHDAEHQGKSPNASPLAGSPIDFARMIEGHWLGITRWWHTKISNDLLEGLNSLIQAAERRARGYRSTRNYIAMIYLVAGHLDLSTHTK